MDVIACPLRKIHVIMVLYVLLCSSSAVLAQQDRTCGAPAILPKSSQTRVMGGQEAAAGSWPWQVRLGFRTGNGITWMCGGSILTEIYIITAAHCLENGQNKAFMVRIGDHDQRVGYISVDEQELSVLRYRIHPNYGGQAGNYANDIAILRVATAITFKTQVSPVCLPPAMQEPVHGTSCYVTGWGNLGASSGPPARLQQGSVQIIGRQVCNTAQYWAGMLRPNEQICAGVPTGSTDACSGDSGGPLVCLNKSTNRWILQGLVSYGPISGCGVKNKPAVYTKVSNFVAWIKETTGNTV